MAEQLTESNFKEKIGEGISLVDFHASWCAPCKVMSPVIDELSKEYEGGNIYKVDVEENMDISNSFNIRSVPTLILFKDGIEVARDKGAKNKQQLLELLSKAE